MSHGLCCEPDCPVSLYQSLQGKYFVGMSSEAFGDGKYAWAGLFNPSCSGVLLFVNVFTVSNPSEIPFSFQIWLNAQTSGLFSLSELVSPSNTAICPIPEPKTQLLYAENVDAGPSDGSLVFGRRCPPDTTIVSEEDGKFIIPPDGNFLINCLPPQYSSDQITGQIAFGWWETPCV